MKHNIKISLVIIGMFLIAQLIGLAVIHAYSAEDKTLPFGMEPQEDLEPGDFFKYMIFAFAVAIALILLLMKLKAVWFMRIWFFVVVTLALALAANAFLMKYNISPYYALAIALPFAFIKIFKQNFIVHNLTELFIYPGIAAVFVPILTLPWVIVLLLLISVYDIYAVWHAGFMQKMAKFQINKVKVFGGFFVPYMDGKTKKQIKLLQQKYKNKKIPNKVMKTKKFKINLAILGGGDVVFPIITAGVVLVTFGLIPALLVSLFATLALTFLLIMSKKGKFYPAMPFITAGCLVGIGLGYLYYLFPIF